MHNNVRLTSTACSRLFVYSKDTSLLSPTQELWIVPPPISPQGANACELLAFVRTGRHRASRLAALLKVSIALQGSMG